MRLAVIFTSLFTLIPHAFAIDQEKILKATYAVVMVRGYNANGGLAYGSGVVVAKNKVMTNCHIFRSTKEPWIARGEDVYHIDSVQADRYHDLCLVTATLPFTPAPIGNGNEIKRGQEVLSIGHSNGVPAPLTSSGAIKSSYEFEGGKIIRSTAQFRMGASGSGLFDLAGNLIGINTFKTPGKPAYFYSLPVEWLVNLEKQPVETKFPIEGKTFWEEEDSKKPYFMQIALPEINKDWPKLEQIAQQWINKDNNNSDAWYELGVAQENLNKLDDAQKSYEESIKLDGKNIESLFRVGAIAKTRGDKKMVHAMLVAITNIDQDLAYQYSEMLGCKEEC